MKIDNFRAQAQANAHNPAAEFRPGDFIYCAAGIGKDCNFIDWLYGVQLAEDGPDHVLCNVVAVMDVEYGVTPSYHL